jgi:hypothetical protein
MAEQDQKFDGHFMSIAQQANGIEPLMDYLFGFLRRKTDFFSGASTVRFGHRKFTPTMCVSTKCPKIQTFTFLLHCFFVYTFFIGKN